MNQDNQDNREPLNSPLSDQEASQQEETPESVSSQSDLAGESWKEEIEQSRVEVQQYKDKYLRSLAEAENARKRLQKENEELVAYALQDLVLDFLQPIDHFSQALKYASEGSEEIKNWAKGFEMILSQMQQVMQSRGIAPFSAVGTPFDPNLHEAVEMIETSEHAAGTVIKQFVEGYKWQDKGKERILRPARVQVAKAPSTAPSTACCQDSAKDSKDSIHENASPQKESGSNCQCS